MREFYFYSESITQKTIEEIFVDFKIHIVSKEVVKKNHFTNKNILLVLNENLPKDLNELFFLKNNVVILLKQNNLDKKKYFKTKLFSKHININKFKDEVITFFETTSFIYKDIEISEEKIINSKINKEVFLTPTEKDILILLFEKTEVQKNFLLESVLSLRQDTETKTIESHLTRIRKKLLSINSQVEIISKDKTVFLVV
tara:strand:- start:594 stop:1193 length:600 start_codon:yes stop_codon:yes gene_type:complete